MHSPRPHNRKKCVILVAAALATSAAAQESRELPRVVVTAQKRVQDANEVGMSISTFDGDVLDDRGVVTVGDLARLTPGMTYTESFFGLPILTMRGIGNDDSQSTQMSPTVGIYVDQVVLPYGILSRGAFFDLERVEVLKGPQGTLFGMSTTGGLVNYITRKPTRTFEAGGRIGADNDERITAHAHVSGPLGRGARARLSAMTRQGGAWQRSMTRGEMSGDDDLVALRGQLELDLADNIDALLRLDHWRDRSDQFSAQPNGLALSNPNSPAALRIPVNHVARDARDAEWAAPEHLSPDNPARSRGYGFDEQLTSATARLTWRLDRGTTLTSLSNVTRFRRDDMFSPIPYPVEGNDLHDKGRIDVFSQELRLSGETRELNWTVGAFFLKDKIRDRQANFVSDDTSAEIVTDVVDLDSFVNDVVQKTTTQAVFAQIEYRLANTLTTTAGMRVNRDRKSFEGCSADTGDGTAASFLNAALAEVLGGEQVFQPGQCFTVVDDGGAPRPQRIVGEQRHTTVSTRLGLDWRPDPRSLFYANVTRGSKSGTFPTVAAFASANLAAVRPEVVTGVEVGTKLLALGNSLSVDAAAYRYDYRDKQIRSYTPDPVFGVLIQLQNLEKSRVTGLELGAKWRATERLTLAARGAITNTEVIRHRGIDRNGAPRDYAGARFPLTPRGQALLSADYRLPLADRGIASIGIDVSRVTATAGTGSFILADPAWAVPARTLVDLRFGFRPAGARWALSATVNNLTDRYYWTDARRLNDVNARYAGRPRTITVNLSYDWF